MRLGQSSRFRGASAGRFVGRDVVTCCAASCFKWSLYKDLAKDDPEAPGYVRSKLACPTRIVLPGLGAACVSVKSCGYGKSSSGKPTRCWTRCSMQVPRLTARRSGHQRCRRAKAARAVGDPSADRRPTAACYQFRALAVGAVNEEEARNQCSASVSK
jgi:hypothetical protein